MAHPIRALIVDDRPRSRKGLRALLATRPEIRVIGEATNGKEAIHMVEKHHPDVVLMDIRMPVMDGLEATRCIARCCPTSRIIVLTLYPSYRITAMDAGAAAFLVKGCPSEELLHVIEMGHTDCQNGEQAYAPTEPTPIGY